MKARIMRQCCAFVALFFVVSLAALFTSCDEHEPIDLDIHSGYILCDDGRIIGDKDFDSSVHTPVGVVFAEQTASHPVLAVLLDEVEYVAFADTLSFDQKTSCSLDSCDGYDNTVALQTTTIMRKILPDSLHLDHPDNYYKSPLGLLAFRSHWFAQSDYVPSVMELELLYKALPTVNPLIQKCGGTPIGTSPSGAGCWYWSSTEVKGNSQNQAWLVSMADGSQHKAPKTNGYRARLIVEYNPYRLD